jgi:cytochrome P450
MLVLSKIGPLRPLRHVITTRHDRTLATIAKDGPGMSVPDLVKVPALPILGSTLSAYSGSPQIAPDRLLQWVSEMHAKYGAFYQLGLPGVGQGSRALAYVITDPNEMLKVVRQEGKHPSGLLEAQWPLIEWAKARGYGFADFLGRGEGWKRYRSFLQKDLLSPQAAREHLPAILEAAKMASKEVPTDGADMAKFMNFCSLDMFSMVLFGSYRKGITPEQHEIFRRSAVYAVSESFKLKREPVQALLYRLGVTSSRNKKLRENLDNVFDIGLARMEAFQKVMEEGQLNGQERNAYIAGALERQRDSDLSIEEVNEIATVMLLASVDTTAGKLSWNLLQMGLNPSIQERLFEEVDKAVQEEGDLTANVFDKSKTPLLQAIVRETHRLTPAAAFNLVKEVQQSPVEIHGVTLPPGSVVIFDSFNPGMNPDLVDDPEKFTPDRWLAEGIQSRKGTPREIIDHPFFTGPFSQGARRCPGSRVANFETQAMLARLILDWKLITPEGLHLRDVKTNWEAVINPVWPELQFIAR